MIDFRKVGLDAFLEVCKHPDNYPRFSLLVWDVVHEGDVCQVWMSTDMNSSFVFRYNGYVAVHGNVTVEHIRKLELTEGGYSLIYLDSHKQELAKMFKDFRPVDFWGAEDLSENHFVIFTGVRDKLNLKWKEKLQQVQEETEDKILVKIITEEEDFKKYNVKLDRDRFEQYPPLTAIVYNETQKETMSYVCLPNIVRQNGWSFGVVRGFRTQRSFTRKGYGTLALLRLQAWAFEEGNLEKIHVFVEETNEPGVKLYEKMGWNATSTVNAARCELRMDIEEVHEDQPE